MAREATPGPTGTMLGGTGGLLAVQGAQQTFRHITTASVRLHLLQVDVQGRVRLIGCKPQGQQGMASQRQGVAQRRGGIEQQGRIASVPVAVVVRGVDGGNALIARLRSRAKSERYLIAIVTRGRWLLGKAVPAAEVERLGAGRRRPRRGGVPAFIAEREIVHRRLAL